MSDPNFILSCGDTAFQVSGIEDVRYNHLIGTGASFINSSSPALNHHIYQDLVPKESCALVILTPKDLEAYEFRIINEIRTYGKYLVLNDVCKVFQMGHARVSKFLFLHYYKVRRPGNTTMKTNKVFIDYEGFKNSDWIKYYPGFDKVLDAIETNMITSRKDKTLSKRSLIM